MGMTTGYAGGPNSPYPGGSHSADNVGAETGLVSYAKDAQETFAMLRAMEPAIRERETAERHTLEARRDAAIAVGVPADFFASGYGQRVLLFTEDISEIARKAARELAGTTREGVET